MLPFLVDHNIVNAFLDKPYDLRAAWDRVAHGTNMDNAPAAGSFLYTPGERQYIRAEAARLYGEQLSQLLPKQALKRRFMLSAGAPGAGKTMLLERLLKGDPSMKGLMFMDPDERALKLMPAYHADIKAFGGGAAGLALSYTKWRWGSNWISNTNMNRACAEGRDILLGTTATSPAMPVLYENARKAGYESETIIVCAPADVRYESARRRFEDEGTRFTNDAKEKGDAFYERLPVLLKHTDHFRLYWRARADAGPVLGATAQGGIVTIHDRNAIDEIDRDLRIAANPLSWPGLRKVYARGLSI